MASMNQQVSSHDDGCCAAVSAICAHNSWNRMIVDGLSGHTSGGTVVLRAGNHGQLRVREAHSMRPNLCKRIRSE